MMTISEETTDEMRSEGASSADIQLDIESITEQQQIAGKVNPFLQNYSEDEQ